MQKLLLFVTDSDMTGAPIYVKEIGLIFSDKYEVNYVVSRNGTNLRGFEMGFGKKRVFGLSDLFAFFRCARILQIERPDIIWLNSLKMSIIVRIVLLFARRKSVKVIYTVHGLSFKARSEIRNTMIVLAERYLMRIVDRFVFLTNHDREVFESKISPTLSNVVIPNFSRLELEFESLKKSVIRKYVMIARNDSQKDFDTLIKAFFDFSKQKDVTLKCIGRDTENLVHKFGVNEGIEYIGESSDVSLYLKESDCLILSTNYEGMPLILLEAMSLGLPLIVTDVSGLSELVTPDFSFFFEKNSVKGLSDCLDQTFSLTSEEVRALSENSRKFYIENFSSNVFRDRYRKFLTI